MNSNISEKLVSETRRWVEIANKKLGIMMPPPTVKLDLKGATAGMAYSMINHIRYNLPLALENEEDFFENTVPHEVAHLVADFYFGTRCNHGPKWKSIMTEVFGKEPKRCHNYDVRNHMTRQIKRYLYACGCGGCEVGPKHHKRIQSHPISRLICRRCNFTLGRQDFSRVVEA